MGSGREQLVVVIECRLWGPKPEQPLGQIVDHRRWWPVGAAGEDADRAAVVRARCERAADRELDVRGSVLAGEQQHVDHLPRGLRRSVAVGQRCPQLVKAVRPPPTLALLVQRDGPGERAGLVDQQLEVMVKLGRDPEPPGQAVVAGDRLAVVGDVICRAPISASTRSPTRPTGTE